tara:strand:+ start:1427 stop:1918 length:492 start_codon:yes stop_codon:yes gene_type:complete
MNYMSTPAIAPIAFLLANGFEESTYAQAQKTMIKNGLETKVVAAETAVVNGWDGQGWGCFFPIDNALNKALAYDFSGLVIPGNKRSIEKMLKTAHSRRFIEGFLTAGKPVLCVGDTSAYTELLAGYEAYADSIIYAHEDNLTEMLSTFTSALKEDELDIADAA